MGDRQDKNSNCKEDGKDKEDGMNRKQKEDKKDKKDKNMNCTEDGKDKNAGMDKKSKEEREDRKNITDRKDGKDSEDREKTEMEDWKNREDMEDMENRTDKEDRDDRKDKTDKEDRKDCEDGKDRSDIDDRKDKGDKEDRKDKEDSCREDSDDSRDSLSAGKKLLLGALLFGAETAINFMQLNELPVLQVLGMPFSLATVTDGIAGPLSILMLTTFGWLTDLGPRPLCRKMAATVMYSGTLVLALVCVVTAIVIHLHDQAVDDASSNGTGPSFMTDSPTLLADCAVNGTDASLEADGGERRAGQLTTDPAGNGTDHLDSDHMLNLTNGCLGDKSPVDYFQRIPFKAWLAMLGFAFMKVSYDGICSFAKSYAVKSAPPTEVRSVLMFSVIMASAGGVSMAALGMLDSDSIPGLSSMGSNSNSLKVIVQAAVVIVCLLLGLPVTLLSGWTLWRRTAPRTASEITPLLTQSAECCPDHLTPGSDGVEASRCREPHSNGVEPRPNGAESPVHNNLFRHPSSISVDEALESNNDFMDMDEKSPLTSSGKITGMKYTVGKTHPSPLYEQEYVSDGRPSLLTPKSPSATAGRDVDAKGDPCSLDGACHSGVVIPRQATALGTSEARMEKGSRSKEGEDKTIQTGFQRRVKVKIALIMLSTALSIGTAAIFSIGISDYVAKAVYRGSPGAQPGSDSQSRYEKGIEMASTGFCVYYVSYLLFNLVNTRLLGYLGCRVEFLLVQLVTAGTMVVLALTARLEVFFVLAAVAGVHRITLHVLPYTAATHMLRTADPDGMRLGLVLSLVTASLPLGAIVFFTWMGMLEQHTGLLSMPLWMGAVYGCVSALVFASVGHVE